MAACQSLSSLQALDFAITNSTCQGTALKPTPQIAPNRLMENIHLHSLQLAMNTDCGGHQPMKEERQAPKNMIPQYEIESLARLLLPAMQAFFESEEGKREFEAWKRQQAEEN
jgi:hypothetical protein